MRLMAALAVASLGVLALTANVSASSSSTRVVSPTVAATYLAEGDEIILLILWRGSPGWFSRSGGSGSSGGGSLDVEWLSATFGDLSFSAQLDRRAGTGKVQNFDIILKDTNVVLVDQVDAPQGPQLAATRRLDLTLTGAEPGDPIQIAIRRNPELFDYLQCDNDVPDSIFPQGPPQVREYLKSLMTFMCQSVRP